MAACIRYSRRHLGRTGTNPSVGTLVVADEGEGTSIVGRGVTAVGGRPHAEPVALAEAGDRARGATAYVTLEPCAHHGRTPPCAEALIAAGVKRVVAAATDPDDRVSGKGYAMLRDAGLEVVPGVLAAEAETVLSSYLTRSARKRAEVTLKLAVSADGMIGKKGAGQVAITGDVARAQSHILRAEHDAILVGVGTAIEDDPELTCRLPGLEGRSPMRVVLDSHLRLPHGSRLVQSARTTPVAVATLDNVGEAAAALSACGVDLIACEADDGRVALPELLEDLAARGVASLLVEGGAAVAEAFMREQLADRIMLFRSDVVIGSDGVPAPISGETVPDGFVEQDRWRFGADICVLYSREN